MAQMFIPELVYYAGNQLLEGPHWDAKNKLLYFVAIDDQMIYQFNEATTEIQAYPTSGSVGAAVMTEGGYILSAEKDGLYSIDPETKKRTFLMQPNTDDRLRYNDGKLDPKGRFLIGTMGYGETLKGAASLYVIDNGHFKEILTDLTLSNGLGWSADGQTFYHIDTPTNKVFKYTYDLMTAELSNKQTLVEITDGGSPDGLCVDLDGHLWVAEYGGKRICKWDSQTGERLIEIALPVSNVSSCCLGGPDLDTLYITTAKKDGEALSGGLFKVKIR